MSIELAMHRYRCRVIEIPHVDNRCVYTHYYWRLMLDKIEIGRAHVGGPVEHSEEKGRGKYCDYSEISVW
jgi:hypothetical protein